MANRDDELANSERSTAPASTNATGVSSTPRAQVGLLGPILVDVNGAYRPVTARRQRAILAYLALHAGQAVSADRLLHAVWGEDLPETGTRTIAYQISRLRSTLEPDRVGEGKLIITSAAGYALRIDPDHVDTNRFERLLAHARSLLSSDPAGCREQTREALALWRGRPFADLNDEPFVETETHRLEQRRLLARRTMAEADMALGRHVEAIGDLEAMIGEQPFEESLVQLLMTVLHRSGRTADALRVYGELRVRLGHELGIEPSHDLQRLEARLLAGHDDAPPVPNATRRRPAVPSSLSSFVGRADELAGIEQLLSSARLVTLVGFGGLGKTRLAQELARRISDRFADGVWYVDLTSIADPNVLADTIVAAGGLTIAPDRDPVEHLISLLDRREALIVIDNCEHLVDDVADLVAKMVAAAPHVRVLATSRISLGVVGEAVWTIHPLQPLSDVELFVDRASVARPGFVVDEANRAEIEHLCDQLDRIPLAIEMAAARLAVMSVAQIADHLDDRFRLLAANGRVSDQRQRSMAAVMDWSYDLLDDADQTLLRRMSVCAGGFDLEAATRIGFPEHITSLADVLDRLSHLVEASLVIFDAGHVTPRYQMLETVRHYCATKLDTDERDEVAFAHATHFDTVGATIVDLQDHDHPASYRLAERELGNLRAAMSWAYGNGHPRLGLAIANNTFTFFNGNGMCREELRWLRAGLDAIDDGDADTYQAAAFALIEASNIADVDAMRAAFAQVERGLDTVDEPRLRAELLSARGAFVDDTDPRAGDAYFVQALDLEASLPHRAMAKLSNRIEVAWEIGRIDNGDAILQHAITIVEAMNSRNPILSVFRSEVAALAGRWDEVLRLAGQEDHLETVADLRLQLARAEALGAIGRFDEAIALADRLEPEGRGRDAIRADVVHAAIDLGRSAPQAAAVRLNELADEIERDGRPLAIGPHVASLLAVAAHDLGQDENAAILFGYAAAEQDRLGITLRPAHRPLAETAIEACRKALGSDRYDQLTARGADTEWGDLPGLDLDVP